MNNIRSIFFTLFAIYFAQGTLYPQGSIISQAALLLIFVISGFFLVKTLTQQNNKNKFYKAWTALLLLNILGFVFTGSLSDPNHINMFKGILMASLPFYPFYYFSQQGILKAKHLLVYFILMLPITILQSFFNVNQILAERLSSNIDVVNNIAYSFVALIPFTFLFKKKKIYAIASMMILMFFIIQGGKRGAFISGTMGFIVFTYYQLKTIDEKYRYRSYLLVFIGVLGLSYFAYDVFQNNEFLIDRLQAIGQGDSSGRDRIYANIFNAWLNTENMFNLLFGFGFAASLSLSGTGNYAHNDWLELLSNFGLLGIVVYMFLFLTAISYIRNKKWDIDKRLLLLTVVLIWFFDAMFARWYISMSGFAQPILLAYLIGNENRSIE